MIRLDRQGVKTPKDWKQRVDAALSPNAAVFWKKARAFEKLAEQGAKRKKGFAAYAPDALPVNAKGKRDFPAVWQKHGEVREAIAAMSHGRCAYCQSDVSSNHAGKGGKEKPPGQIEHFKPKSRFPMQAYAVSNYFLGCMGCNGAKSDQWPASGYVRPDRGQPGQRFVFAKNGKMKAARARDMQAKKTIEDLDLNRYWLKFHRKGAIRDHVTFVQNLLNVPGIPLDKLLLPEHARFSEAINQNVWRVWAEAMVRRP